jgi:hypothetical protein
VRQQGGGAGGSLTFAPVTGGVISNPLAYAPASNCQAAARPGFMEGGYRGFHGLPGMPAPMLGGRRATRKGKKSKKTQRGGSYSIVNDGTVAGFPGSAGIAGVVSTGCSAPSQTAIPPSGAADNLNSRSSYLWQKGGAVVTGSDLAAAAAPLAGVATAVPSITVPTAGYSHLTGAASVGTTSAGTKFMINVPGDGRAAACMKGGSRKSKKLRKSKKSKSKKSRKSKSKRN